MSVLDLMVAASTEKVKQLAVLIDPDEYTLDQLDALYDRCIQNKVNYLFFGGSLLTESGYEEKLGYLKALSKIPVILFPGSVSQISSNADAILFLSLISGRNPDLLIGQHVIAAPQLRKSGIEVLPTGYMLVDCGNPTTASYVSGTSPLPYDKPGIASATALAGQMLGLQLMYMDGGSGAAKPVSVEMIEQVKRTINIPLIVGGGIRTAEQASSAYAAGADVIVVGNQIEKDPSFIEALAKAKATTLE